IASAAVFGVPPASRDRAVWPPGACAHERAVAKPRSFSSEDPPDLFFLPLLRRVQIDHRGLDVGVPEDTLNRLELRAVVEEICRAGVPEFMRRELHAEQRPGATQDHLIPRPRNERLPARVKAVATG